MARVSIDQTYLTNIADAIRTKASTSSTYKTSEMASAILNLPGGTINLKPVALRPDAEKWKTYTYDQTASDLDITLPEYTTTSTTLQTTANITPTYQLDLDNYDYCVVVKALTIPEYSITTKAKGREEYAISINTYELINIPANSLFTSLDGTTKYASRLLAFCTQSNPREIYYSSGTAIGVYASAAYGYNQTIAVPTVTAAGVLTLRRPAFIVRGNTTYFVNTFMNAVTDVRFQFVQDIWRAPRNNLNVDGWGEMQALKQVVADALSSSHTLT